MADDNDEKKDGKVIDFRRAAKRLGATHLVSATLDQLCPLWIADRAADGNRQRGVDSYEHAFQRFMVWIGTIRASNLTVEDIRDYKRDLMERVSATTTSHALTVITAFCDWAVAEGYMATNVAREVKHPKVTAPDPDPLSREQVAALLTAIDTPSKSHKATWPRNRRAVVLMLYAGLRLNETAGLRRGDIDLDRRELTVRGEIAKWGKPRTVPICDELLVELESIRGYKYAWAVVDQGNAKGKQGVPLTFKSLAHLFERWLPNRLDFHIHAHQLRKTFATELHVRGEDIVTIQRLLGHNDPKTTMRYIGASSKKEHDAVDRLTFRAELDEEED